MFRIACLVAAAVAVGCGAASSDDERALTLDNCPTDIASDAPAFFRRYFHCVTARVSGDAVVIESDGLPPHQSNYFEEDHPNWVAFDTSRGERYRPAPGRLSRQSLSFTIPNAPVSRGLTLDAAMVDGVARSNTSESAGLALDGTALFNPLARPGDDIAEERFTFDAYNAHPSPDGTYHYHSFSRGPLEVLARKGLVTTTTPGQAAVELFGIMCDGTVVMGCTELDGALPEVHELDAQGGHVHDLVADDGVMLWAGRYHTHLCEGRHPFVYAPEIQLHTTCER